MSENIPPVSSIGKSWRYLKFDYRFWDYGIFYSILFLNDTKILVRVPCILNQFDVSHVYTCISFLFHSVAEG